VSRTIGMVTLGGVAVCAAAPVAMHAIESAQAAERSTNEL
jgi:hypothetical protein